MQEAEVVVRIWGDFACFSRPEFKSERVSYLVVTPSAARGVLEAIFWKPEFQWEIREIAVLSPIRHFALIRNEISDRQGERPIRVEEKRQQRASLVLRDVDYRIRASLVLAPHATDPLAKYTEQFQRRLQRGQYHHAPYLGVREFAAAFAPVGNADQPLPINLDLGPMLFDLAFVAAQSRSEMTFRRHDADGGRVVRGYAQALFFRARLERGVMYIPRDMYSQRRQLQGGNSALGAV